MIDVEKLFNLLHQKHSYDDRKWSIICERFNFRVSLEPNKYNLSLGFIHSKFKDYKINYVFETGKHGPRLKLYRKYDIICVYYVDNKKLIREHCKHVPKEIDEIITTILKTCWDKIKNYKPNNYSNLYFAFRIAIEKYLNNLNNFCEPFRGD